MCTQVFVFAPRSQGLFLLVLATRIIAIALLFTVLCPTLLGQMHSTRATDGPVRIGLGPQVRPPLSVSRTGVIGSRPLGHRSFVAQRFPFRHHLRFNLFLANACFTDPFFDPFLCRQFFFRNPFFFPSPIFFNQAVVLPYPIPAAQPYGVDQQASSMEQEQENALTQRIDRLTDEVEKLREQQASTAESRQPEVQHQQTVLANQPTKIIVFRDGRRREIQNYAMVGNTVWVLTEQIAQKISISDLDTEATRKLNADRGVEFP